MLRKAVAKGNKCLVCPAFFGSIRRSEEFVIWDACLCAFRTNPATCLSVFEQRACIYPIVVLSDYGSHPAPVHYPWWIESPRTLTTSAFAVDGAKRTENCNELTPRLGQERCGALSKKKYIFSKSVGARPKRRTLLAPLCTRCREDL